MNDGIIEHVTQTEALNCVSATLSMVLRKDIDVITNEFHLAYRNNQMEPHDYLTEHQVPFRHCLAAERSLKSNCIYICTVPSLNIKGGTHSIVIEMMSETTWRIFDPNLGREGRINYNEHLDDGGVIGWSPNYEFKKKDLIAYWDERGLF